MYKITTLTCPLPPPSTPVRATPSELPSLRRSRSCKRPARRNPPANALLANAHEMSMERRKPHRHDTPPSRIDPSLCWDGYTSALPVESHLLRAATPTEGPICAENPGRKREEKMVSSNTRRSAAMKPRFNGIPRANRGWPARWRPAWPVAVTANLRSGLPECAPACKQQREQGESV